MPDKIHLLPDAIANQIAAGEVIQRPASAVKELMENSIDAGAKKIHLFIKDAGKTLIQVIDDGCGMSETDARMSFERHATSKIKNIDDLFALHTMGFRGEALASIAAIAQVELKTRREEDDLGICLRIEGSKVISQLPCQCAKGSSLSIKNLFYNVPARRQFLKSNSVELRHIIDEFTRIALSHPSIYFILTSQEEELFHLRPGTLKQRIAGILGDNMQEKIIPVEEPTDYISVSGFVGKPEAVRKTRGDQFFFVNNRFIKSPYLNHAITTAYNDLISRDGFPVYVLFININPAKIDVNVHPTKQEIKFDDERTVYNLLLASVKRAIGIHCVSPMIDFDLEPGIQFPIFNGSGSQNYYNGPSALPASGGDTYSQTGFLHKKDYLPRNWQELYETPSPGDEQETFTIQSRSNIPVMQQGEQLSLDDKIEPRPLQVHQRYFIYQIKSGLVMVDQQAAHERILYEQLKEKNSDVPTTTQKLLFPQSISVPVNDALLLREVLPSIQDMGYDLEQLGPQDFVLYGVPANRQASEDIEEILQTILEELKIHSGKLSTEKEDTTARAMVRLLSVKPGRKLSEEEMKNMIDELFACKTPYISPSGRLTFITLSLEELDKQFQSKK